MVCLSLIFLVVAMLALCAWMVVLTVQYEDGILTFVSHVKPQRTGGKKTGGVYADFFPMTYKHRSSPVNASYRESFPKAFTTHCASNSSFWSTCDAPACLRNNTELLVANMRKFKKLQMTQWNQSTSEYLHQQVLKRAWGRDPPMIDMYVRAGCRGVFELLLLYRTLELFWPAHLGDLIIVLDWNDRENVDLLVDRTVLKDFSIHVVFEHQPCLPGRLFNQYSYLNLYRYSNAEFVVTIDSDCALHRPVTPDVLFSSEGLLILPTNTLFQPYQWHKPQMFFTKIDELEWGHTMVSQPVAFRVESFPQYFAYINKMRRGKCYEKLLVDFYLEYRPRLTFHCWMCQLGAYIAHYNKTGYDILVTNKRPHDPYLRYASHVSYEKSKQRNYEDSVHQSTMEGLCYWLGDRVFGKGACDGVLSVYLYRLIFRYNYFNLASSSSEEDKSKALLDARRRLNSVI